MGLLAVPRATVGRPQAVGDPTDGGDGREIDIGIHRRKDHEASVEHDEGFEGEGALARCGYGDERMERRVVLPQQREVGLYIDDEDDRAQGREGVTVERARGNDVDAAGKPREECLERAGKIRRRARARAPASGRRAPSSAAGASTCTRCP